MLRKFKNIFKKWEEKFIFSGEVSRLVLGEVEELWDWVAVVEYPSKKAMRSMIMDKEYLKSEEHRGAGLAGQLKYRNQAASMKVAKCITVRNTNDPK